MDDGARQWLRGRFGDAVRFGEPMARHTSLGVGGAADALVFPTSPKDLAAVMTGAWQRRIPYRVMGGGTNLLVPDRGIPGIVISLAGGLRRLSRVDDPEGGVRVMAEAGVATRSLCRFCIQEGLGGMNFALGIPGTVGGALRMNAGTAGGAMIDRLLYIEVAYPMGAPRRIFREHLHGGYRKLSWDLLVDAPLGYPPVILGGAFRMTPAAVDVLRADARRIMKSRAAGQPGPRGSAGCFFKNPSPEAPAGRLIEEAGLKGSVRGGAMVSRKHANFIVNTGGATAEDMLGLIKTVQEAVLDRFGLLLEPEVQIVEADTNPEK